MAPKDVKISMCPNCCTFCVFITYSTHQFFMSHSNTNQIRSSNKMNMSLSISRKDIVRFVENKILPYAAHKVGEGGVLGVGKIHELALY